jgi:hypothetical protein
VRAGPRFGGPSGARPDHDLDARVAQIQRVRLALIAEAEDRHGLEGKPAHVRRLTVA